MPRLSIVIPYLAAVEPLESTLASVLQNRPRGCEILVVHNGAYEDPYNLRGEVRFVETATEAPPAETLNAGCRAARGTVLHFLQPGAEVEEGWAEPALARFDDPAVAAVAPLVLDAQDRQRVLSAGIAYGPGGGRWIHAHGRLAESLERGRLVLGPTLRAAFYRRHALASVGAIDPRVGLEMADVEVALSLRARGFRAALEPQSRVYCPKECIPCESAFDQGQGAERVFWRHASEVGWLPSLLLHPMLVASEFAAGLPRGGAVSRLLGRVVACLNSSEARDFDDHDPPPSALTARARGASIRIDPSHQKRKPRAPQPREQRERAA